jgi:hypothetical protein
LDVKVTGVQKILKMVSPSPGDMRTCCYMSMNVAARRSARTAAVLLVIFVFRY